MGYFGYDVVREVEHLPDIPPDNQGLPDAILAVIGELAVYDHWRQRVILLANVFVPDGASDDELDRLYEQAIADVEQLAADGARPLPEPMLNAPTRAEEMPDVTPSMTKDMYCRAVEVAKEHVLAGDIFQAVLSTRFDFELGADSFDVYRVLRQINPSPYMYYVRHPELTLVGCSPEPMVQLLEDRVISRPIAGTRRRGRTDEEDRRMAAELSEHPKERAEHVMLVDLARNDVGRVVEYGSLRVDEMMTLERYSHVMHLTSQVSGEIRAESLAGRRHPGHPARGNGVGRAQGSGHGDHRRPRTGQAGPLRRHRWLRRLLRQHRHCHRHPDHGHPREPGLGAGRRRHRRRQHPRGRVSRVPEQGPRPAHRGSGRSSYDG